MVTNQASLFFHMHTSVQECRSILHSLRQERRAQTYTHSQWHAGRDDSQGRNSVIGSNCFKMSRRRPPIIYLNLLIMGGWKRGGREEGDGDPGRGRGATPCRRRLIIFVLTDTRAQPLDEWAALNKLSRATQRENGLHKQHCTRRSVCLSPSHSLFLLMKEPQPHSVDSPVISANTVGEKKKEERKGKREMKDRKCRHRCLHRYPQNIPSFTVHLFCLLQTSSSFISPECRDLLWTLF